MRIPVIFEIEGEEGFRKRESQVLAKLSSTPDLVLATGGGAVLAEENRRCMRESGVVIYLHSPPEVLYERTRHDRNRPLLQVSDPQGALRNLYELRDPIYRETAHLVIDSMNGPTGLLAERIENELRTLCEP